MSRDAAAHDVRAGAADLAELLRAPRPPLGELHQRRVAQHAADRAVLGGGGALAPGRELARLGPLAGAEPRDPRQPAPRLLGVALVGGGGDREALLARPLEPPALAQPALQLVGQRQQVLDVLAGVADLLGRERARVPAGERRRLREPDPQHVVQQPGVAGLGAEAGEAGRDLRVEHVRERRVPRAAQDRDVLAAGVQHDLDRRVGEHGGERRRITDAALERIEHDHLARRGDLHEAEQRPVAALRHELRVDAQPPFLPRACRDALQLRRQ